MPPLPTLPNPWRRLRDQFSAKSPPAGTQPAVTPSAARASGLHEAGASRRAGMEEHAANSPKRTEGASQFGQPSGLSTLNKNEQIALLRDIKNGTVKEGYACYQEEVIGYINKHLERDKEIAPGLWSTGFDHVRDIATLDAVIPEGWSKTPDAEIIGGILDASIAHLEAGGGPKDAPPHAISLKQVSLGKPPNSAPKPAPGSEPICGVNSFKMPTVVLPAKHKAIGAIDGALHTSHPSRVKLKGDESSWSRCAWLAILGQFPPDRIQTDFPKIQADPEGAAMLERIEQMARALQSGKGLAEVKKQAAHSRFELRYPDTVAPADRDKCEDDLKALGTALLSAKLASHPELQAKGEDASRITALLDVFEMSTIIVDRTQSLAGKSIVSISGLDENWMNSNFQHGTEGEQADIAKNFCSRRPVFIRTKEGFEFLMPEVRLEQEEPELEEPLPTETAQGSKDRGATSRDEGAGTDSNEAAAKETRAAVPPQQRSAMPAGVNADPLDKTHFPISEERPEELKSSEHYPNMSSAEARIENEPPRPPGQPTEQSTGESDDIFLDALSDIESSATSAVASETRKRPSALHCRSNTASK